MTTYPIKVGPASGPAASVVYISMVAASPSYDRYPTKLSIRLGIIQALLGGLSILFNIISLVFLDGSILDGYGKVGHGIWCGVLFIITGAIGISAGKKKKKSTIVAYMVMCIIAASFTFFLVQYGILGAYAYSPIRFNCLEYRDAETCMYISVVFAMETCMAITGFIEAALFIWGSVMCCMIGLCCCSRSYQPMTLQDSKYVQLTESKHHDDPPPVYKEEKEEE